MKQRKMKHVLAFVMALVLSVMTLGGMSVEVSAAEQVKIELTYVYVNNAGDNAVYVDTQYVTAGTTWGEFFNSYVPCYESGVISDAREDNVWELSVQRFINGLDYYASQEIVNFNQYTDCALVDFNGCPADYEKVYFGFEYIENGTLKDSGTGWSLMVPTAYKYGSAEALDYVKRNAKSDSYIAGYYNMPGAVVTIEAPDAEELEPGRSHYYIVSIVVASSGASSPTGGAVVTTPVESEHTLANGEEVRMVTVKGNSNVYVIGNPDYIPTGATFSSTAVTAGEVYTNAAAAVQNKYGKAADFCVFEMNLTDASNNAISQLAGYINVTLPIPAGMATEEGETIRAYRLESNGKLTKLDTAVANGQVTFATNHFSTYVLVEENAMMSPKTGDTFGVMPVVILVIALAGVALYRKKVIA